MAQELWPRSSRAGFHLVMTTIEGQDLRHVDGLWRDFSQGVDEPLLVPGEHRIPSTLEGDGASRDSLGPPERWSACTCVSMTWVIRMFLLAANVTYVSTSSARASTTVHRPSVPQPNKYAAHPRSK